MDNTGHEALCNISSTNNCAPVIVQLDQIILPDAAFFCVLAAYPGGPVLPVTNFNAVPRNIID